MSNTLRDVLLWAAVRLVVVVMLLNPSAGPLMIELSIYESWSLALASGTTPSGDTWQYPPGYAILLGLAGWSGLGLPLLLGAILAADVAILISVRNTAGAPFWALAPLLIGPIFLTRLDVVVTAFAVVALVPRRTRLASGILLGLGTSMKLWPGTLVAALSRPGVRVRALAIAGVYGLVTIVSGVLFGTDAFLTNMAGRGLQVESVAAFPFMVAGSLGAPVEISFENGSHQVDGPLADAIAAALPYLSAGCVAVLAVLWFRRPDPELVAPRSLLMVSLLLVTSRVLSPQFNVWVLGLISVTIARGLQTRGIVISATMTALAAHALYPFAYSSYLSGGLLGLSIQFIRVASLVFLAWFSWRISGNQRHNRDPVRLVPRG